MGDAADDMMFRELGSANALFEMQRKQKQAGSLTGQKITLTDVNRVYDWAVSLRYKGKGFTTNINNWLLYNAMMSHLLIHTLDVEDLMEAADAAIQENTHFENGTMDIEEAVRVAVRAAYNRIYENVNHG